MIRKTRLRITGGIDAPDFSEMLNKAFEKRGNLRTQVVKGLNDF